MPSLVSGIEEKGSGDTVRLPMDFGNIRPLYQGAAVEDGVLTQTTTISSYSITCPGLTVSLPQMDYESYQISAVFSGGTSGSTYTATYTINLSNGLIISRQARIKVV